MSRRIARKAFDLSATGDVLDHASDLLKNGSSEDVDLRAMADDLYSAGSDYSAHIHVAAHERVPHDFVPSSLELNRWKAAAARFIGLVMERDPAWLVEWVDGLPDWGRHRAARRLRGEALRRTNAGAAQSDANGHWD